MDRNIESVNEEGRILWKKITVLKYNYYSTQFTLLEVSSSLDKFYVVSPAVLELVPRLPTGAGDHRATGTLLPPGEGRFVKSNGSLSNVLRKPAIDLT